MAFRGAGALEFSFFGAAPDQRHLALHFNSHRSDMV